MGIYAQALELLGFHNLNPWLSTREVFLFNDHFDPVLFFLLPFKGFVPAGLLAIRVEMLSLILAAASPLWLWRRGELSLALAVIGSALMVTSPMVLDAAFYPAHPGTWSLAPLSWMLAFLVAERFGWALIMFVVTLTCKEEYPFVGMAVGLGLLISGPRSYGLRFITVGFVWALLVFVVRPTVLGPASMYTDAVSGFQGASFLASGDAVGLLVRRFLEVLLPASVIFYGVKRGSLRSIVVPGFVLLVLLGIRFAGGYWGNHRMAPVAVALAYLMIFARSHIVLSRNHYASAFLSMGSR